MKKIRNIKCNMENIGNLCARKLLAIMKRKKIGVEVGEVKDMISCMLEGKMGEEVRSKKDMCRIYRKIFN